MSPTLRDSQRNDAGLFRGRGIQRVMSLTLRIVLNLAYHTTVVMLYQRASTIERVYYGNGPHRVSEMLLTA
jgi:hypothetical protein